MIVGKTDKPQRNASIELLRIIAMLLITTHHFALHGEYNFTAVTFNSVTVNILELSGKAGVNIFVLIMGYFFDKSRFSLAKVGKLLGLTSFYSTVTAIVAVAAGAVEFRKKLIIRALFPYIFSRGYWFVIIYIELYFLSVVLKEGLKKISNKELFAVIGMLFLTLTVLPYSIGQLTQISEYGYSSLIWFVFVYLTGAFIKKNNEKLKKKQPLWIILLIASTVLMTGGRIFSDVVTIEKSGILFKILRIALQVLTNRSLNSPMMIIISVLFLIVFSNIEVKPKKWIFSFGTATFGVYLIHDSPWFSEFLWTKICRTSQMQDAPFFILYAVACIIIVYLSCSLIEIGRKTLLKKVISSASRKKSSP